MKSTSVKLTIGLFSLTWALVSASTTHAAAGGDVGNGGDGIKCVKDPANRFDGIYALDYLVTLPKITGDDGLAKVSTWKESAARITKLLRRNSPSLAQSFEHFAKLVYNTSFAYDRVWEPSPFGLAKLDDQRLTSLLPANCKTGTDPMIMQAVIRLYEGYSGTTPGHIVYKYDPQLLTDIEKQDAVQLSFLLVHEWLWDVSPNVERNRRVNRFLHEIETEKLTPNEFVLELKGMGLRIPELQADEFDEQSCQGYPMTEKELFDYYPGGDVMANFGLVKVSIRERETSCNPHQPDCDLNWKKPRLPTRMIEDHEFFLSPSWGNYKRGEPLKLVSPQLIAKEGRYLRPGAGELACKFVNDPKNNLECSIQHPNLRHALFNYRYEEISDYTRLPKLPAKITQECFWIKTSGHYTISGVGPRGSHTTLVEREVVLSVRAKTVFLKP